MLELKLDQGKNLTCIKKCKNTDKMAHFYF